MPEVPAEAERASCVFKTRLGRSKGILIPLLWHALPEGQSTPHSVTGGVAPPLGATPSHTHVAGVAWDK